MATSVVVALLVAWREVRMGRRFAGDVSTTIIDREGGNSQ
jgi:hypothetical protein